VVAAETEEVVRLSFESELGRGRLDFIELDPEFNLIVSDCRFTAEGLIVYAGEGWLRFNFCLDANASFAFGERGAYRLRGCQLRVFRQPEGIACEHRFTAGRSVCATLSLSEARLRSLLSGGAARPELTEGGQGDFFFRRLQMSSEAIRAVRALVAMPYTGALRRLYTRAKAEELLVSALSAEPVSEAMALPLAEGERRRLAELGRFLEGCFAQPPTLAALARRCGMNRNKLTRGFREVHGCSIGERLTRLRLEAARRLLDGAELSVSEIAAQVGYSHVQSFSSAFRRHFGVAPSGVRRRDAAEIVPRSYHSVPRP
jgi:AraC-like DNA-binding protein